MTVGTIYCDGSWKEGHAGWGIWVRTDTVRMAWYGRVPEERIPRDTRHGALLAEGYAALAGLHLARKYDPAARVITVKTDCRELISVANRGLHKVPEVAEMQARLRAKVLQWDEVRWSWVKGHQKGEKVKAYLNRKADEFARRGRLQDRPVVREFIQRVEADTGQRAPGAA